MIHLLSKHLNFYEFSSQDCFASGLEHDFRQLLHGQHLVSHTLLRSISGHFRNENPEKALVLSLHGCTGCGKNFVSKIVAKNLYLNGMNSKFVHLFVATHHFPHEDQVNSYKVKYKLLFILPSH